ncbi:MAG: cupredoxin domain-containing protein [Actinomycetota bacterium]
MRKTLSSVVLVLALAATACGGVEAPEIDLGSGVRFVPLVVDALNDAGRFPSVVVTAEGRPVVAYFGFADDLAEGEIAAPRPIGAPSVPGVLIATVGADGVWTRGAIVMQASIPNVQMAFAPAIDDAVKDLTAGTATGLDLAIDADGGLHAVWGSAQGLWYASGSSDPRTTMQWVVEKVAESPPSGLAVTVDASGSPWISYESGGAVFVGSRGAGAWTVRSVSPASTACDGGCGTDLTSTTDGVAVAFTDADGALTVARPDATVGVGNGFRGWTFDVVAADGRRPSLAASADTLVVGYAGANGGHVATVAASGLVSDILAVDGGAPAVGVDAAAGVTAAWEDPARGIGLAVGTADGALDTVTTPDVGAAARPSVAVGADGASFVSWFDPVNTDLLVGVYAESELAFAVPSPTVGPTEVTGAPMPPTNCVDAVDGTVGVVAVGVAFTDGACIRVVADEPFTIAFDNQDPAASVGQHNIAIFPSANDLANPLFRGELVSGPATVDYAVDALPAGQYFYHCDVHPTMTGSVIAEAAGGGGNGGGGGGGGAAGATTVVAMGLMFDTNALAFTAGKAASIAMDNQDAGVPHNIAIYPSATDLANPLFRGDLITGPATISYDIPALDPGTYYFQCDVHPTMNGTVTVA